MSDAPVFVVFKRKRCPSGRVIRKYVRIGGSTSLFTEQSRFAQRFESRERAEKIASIFDDGHVVEAPELPAPKVSAGLSGGLWT